MTFEPTKRRAPAVASLLLTAGIVVAGVTALTTAATAQTDMEPAEAAAAPADDTVVATINGHEITEADMRIGAESYGDVLANVPDGRVREALIDTLIDLHLVTAAAEAAELDQDADFLRRMELLRQRVLQAGYFTEEIAPTVTDDLVHARYDELIAEAELPDEVRASHILVETEDEAKQVLSDLEEGGDFAEIAKERSKDPGSAPQGGDLDYFAKEEMVAPFAEAAFALGVGETTEEPVQTSFGWHVIKVVDRRKQKPPSFEQVSEQLRDTMVREAVLAKVTSLREAADIVIVEVAEPADGEMAEDPAEEAK